MDYHLKSIECALAELNSSIQGLEAGEAARRLADNGPNELGKPKLKGLFKRFMGQLANPMLLVLLGAAVVSAAIALTGGGDAHGFVDSGIIFLVVALNCALGVLQESKAERAIEALSAMNAATAKALRGGTFAELNASELVAGDVVLIESGDAVPADLRLLKTASLRVDESSLTGESCEVRKRTEALQSDGEAVSLGDRSNMAYMGTGVSYGRGTGLVVATGMATELGKIAGLLQTTSDGKTPLQKKLTQLSKVLSAAVLGICAVIFIIRIAGAGYINAGVFISSFMLAVSLAVAAIPEGLAAVVTVVLSIGVTKMAKRNAIVRRLTSVETLGCAEVICTDKTGTLTLNKMTVVEFYGDADALAKAMALCNDSRPGPDGSVNGSPTETALVAFAQSLGFDKNALESDFPRVGEIPFERVRKLMTTVHRAKQSGGAAGDRFAQYTKGAPDEVLKRCDFYLDGGVIKSLTESEKVKISDVNARYAGRSLRVLACAHKECGGAPDESGLTFIGLAAISDPVRPEVAAALGSCKAAGIKVVMITGDHAATAAAIAGEIGLLPEGGKVINGSELDSYSDAEFEKIVGETFVYARVQPEHKVRIVEAWQRKGFVAAMTGDGTNDAPAIKAADIGIGMGATGTDVTKNVADMVLADDNFATIVSAVTEGRRIYDNIRKTVQFLLSTNLSEVISVFAATLIGFTLFKPVHLLFINLVTDTFPAVALGIENSYSGLMERNPRPPKESVFSNGVGVNILIQGTFIAMITLAAYFIENAAGGPEKAMTSAFFALSMCEIFQAFTLRSLDVSVFKLKTRNKALWASLAFSLMLTFSVIYVPVLADAFSLKPLSPIELAVSTALALSIVPMVEVSKSIGARLSARPLLQRASQGR